MTRDEVQRTIALDRGAIVGAESSLARDQLPSALSRPASGPPAEQRLRTPAWVGMWEDSGEGGPVTPEALVQEHVRRMVVDCFAWRGGVYQISVVGHPGRAEAALRISVGDVVARSILLHESVSQLRATFGDDVRLGPRTSAPFLATDVRLSNEEAACLRAMDGSKTIGDLRVLFPELPERVVRGLGAAGCRLGILGLVGRGPAEARKISFF